jgi:NADH-quinone oxidoreductase subunit J
VTGLSLLLFTLLAVVAVASAVSLVLVVYFGGKFTISQSTPARPLDWIAAGGVALLLAGVLGWTVWGIRAPEPTADHPASMTLVDALLGSADSTPEGKMTNLPAGLSRARPRTAFAVPLALVVVHLVVVVVGALYLTRGRKEDQPS